MSGNETIYELRHNLRSELIKKFAIIANLHWILFPPLTCSLRIFITENHDSFQFYHMWANPRVPNAMSTKYKECSCNSLTGGNMNCILAACCKWLNTLGEKLLQRVKATRKASKLIALCIEAFLWKSLFPQYVAQNQVRIKFVQLVAATKILLQRQRLSQKFFKTHKAICL